MEYTLYADVLFLINFSMDVISLYITMKITNRSYKLSKLALSASAGAFYGVLDAVFIGNRAVSLFTAIAVSFIMILIAAGIKEKPISYIKSTFILWGTGALIAGAVSMICSLGDFSGEGGALYYGDKSAFFVLFCGVITVALFVKIMFSVSPCNTCTASIYLGGKEVIFEGICDNGNLLREPVSGMPVLFITRRTAERVLDKKDISVLTEKKNFESLSPLLKGKIRMIQSCGVDGKNVLYCGFIPDSVVIKKYNIGKVREKNSKNIKKEKAEKNIKKVKCVAVISDAEDFNGMDAVIPPSLI